jgi:hypothetical protein
VVIVCVAPKCRFFIHSRIRTLGFIVFSAVNLTAIVEDDKHSRSWVTAPGESCYRQGQAVKMVVCSLLVPV